MSRDFWRALGGGLSIPASPSGQTPRAFPPISLSILSDLLDSWKPKNNCINNCSFWCEPLVYKLPNLELWHNYGKPAQGFQHGHGSKSRTPSGIPIPTKISSKMGGAPTPKWYHPTAKWPWVRGKPFFAMPPHRKTSSPGEREVHLPQRLGKWKGPEGSHLDPPVTKRIRVPTVFFCCLFQPPQKKLAKVGTTGGPCVDRYDCCVASPCIATTFLAWHVPLCMTPLKKQLLQRFRPIS